MGGRPAPIDRGCGSHLASSPCSSRRGGDRSTDTGSSRQGTATVRHPAMETTTADGPPQQRQKPPIWLFLLGGLMGVGVGVGALSGSKKPAHADTAGNREV
jgi:hypothetical protein